MEEFGPARTTGIRCGLASRSRWATSRRSTVGAQRLGSSFLKSVGTAKAFRKTACGCHAAAITESAARSVRMPRGRSDTVCNCRAAAARSKTSINQRPVAMPCQRIWENANSCMTSSGQKTKKVNARHTGEIPLRHRRSGIPSKTTRGQTKTVRI